MRITLSQRTGVARSASGVAGLLLLAVLVAACSAPSQSAPEAAAAPRVLTVATHDSFAVSEEVVQAFEAEQNASVQFLSLGDAGEALNKVILSRDAPLADLFFGVDNTFLSRALANDVFVPYESPLLANVPDDLKLDAKNRLLPVDFGYVTLNADRAWFEERSLPLPQSLDELAAEPYRGLLVVQNPATSSPGLAFLLATIAEKGEDWPAFWAALRANDVLAVDGWTQAYYEHFTVGSGGLGDRPLVVSYSTSPPADVLFATDGRTEPASTNVNLAGGVFQQIEFVGILRGAREPELAQAWVDFMLERRFQEDIPLQMFVYPANSEAALPDLFAQFAEAPANAATIDASAIEENRDAWLAQWSETMLR